MTILQLQPKTLGIMVEHELKRIVGIEMFEQLNDHGVPMAGVDIRNLDDTFVAASLRPVSILGLSGARRTGGDAHSLAGRPVEAEMKGGKARDYARGEFRFEQLVHEGAKVGLQDSTGDPALGAKEIENIARERRQARARSHRIENRAQTVLHAPPVPAGNMGEDVIDVRMAAQRDPRAKNKFVGGNFRGSAHLPRRWVPR